jgi:4-amino-4-deoxy-L-arabinose transferase-like glycosyltransferase
MTEAEIALGRPTDVAAPIRAFAVSRTLAVSATLGGIAGVAFFLRLWELNAFGFNSDEAVYAGQAASIADHPNLKEFFPTFRAHPLLFQTILSVGYHLGGYDLFGRVVAAVFGVATVLLIYKTGKVLYGTGAGLLAALFMALMPYHVVVTRQVLLDGPMVFFATLSLCLVAMYATTAQPVWLYAAGGAMGCTVLAKETSILLVGSLYAFFALAAKIRVRIRDLVFSLGCMSAVIISFPISMRFGGQPETGGQYLAWQLFRRPNHDLAFYGVEVPRAIGYLVVGAAILGLIVFWAERSWREKLLLTWIVVPVAFFELWPVKGFQYLLPAAPAVALLAAMFFARWWARCDERIQKVALGSIVAAVACTLLIGSWYRIQPPTDGTFLAGSGGVPGGREAGNWIAAHVPEGAEMLTVGPSMANIVRFYGHRKAYGLSVSPNPLRRNPAYEPIDNPDLRIRNNELQYIVWDSFSAARSPFFSKKLLRYADRYNGRAIHTQLTTARTASGRQARVPLIIVYAVRP